LVEGERILNDLVYECQRSLEGIEHARLDLEARGWARGMGLRERLVGGCGLSPPTDWGELVQIHDDRAIFQESPDELPVIDIQSL